MRKRKSLRAFIREHRRELDQFIHGKVPNITIRLNDEDRRLWILSDETLYLWAREEGVDI